MNENAGEFPFNQSPGVWIRVWMLLRWGIVEVKNITSENPKRKEKKVGLSLLYYWRKWPNYDWIWYSYGLWWQWNDGTRGSLRGLFLIEDMELLNMRGCKSELTSPGKWRSLSYARYSRSNYAKFERNLSMSSIYFHCLVYWA